MIVIAECRNLQMSEVLAHPLEPFTSVLPWTLAKPNGTLSKTNEGTLAKELKNNVKAACLLEGMALASKG